MAQTPDRKGSSQQDRLGQWQVVETYDKFPDSDGDHQDFTATTYESKPADQVYDEKDYERYEVKNDANDGVRYRPTIKVVEPATP